MNCIIKIIRGKETEVLVVLYEKKMNSFSTMQYVSRPCVLEYTYSHF